MLNRPLNAVLVRLAIVAVALAALLLIAPAATAQEADADPPPPCMMNGRRPEGDVRLRRERHGRRGGLQRDGPRGRWH